MEGKGKQEMGKGEVGVRRKSRGTVHRSCPRKGSVDNGERMKSKMKWQATH